MYNEKIFAVFLCSVLMLSGCGAAENSTAETIVPVANDVTEWDETDTEKDVDYSAYWDEMGTEAEIEEEEGEADSNTEQETYPYEKADWSIYDERQGEYYDIDYFSHLPDRFHNGAVYLPIDNKGGHYEGYQLVRYDGQLLTNPTWISENLENGYYSLALKNGGFKIVTVEEGNQNYLRTYLKVDGPPIGTSIDIEGFYLSESNQCSYVFLNKEEDSIEGEKKQIVLQRYDENKELKDEQVLYTLADNGGVTNLGMGMFMIRDYEADTQFLYDCEREQQFNYDFDGSIYCAYSASGFGTLNDGGNCCVIDRDGNIVMQHSGHSIGMVSDDGYVIIDNSLYNVNDSSVINFTSYTLAHSAYFDGDYAVINLKSEEGEYYCTLLTKQGEFVFDPIPGEGSQCLEGGRFFVGYSGYNEHMVYCLDLQGKEIWRDNRGRDAHNLGEGIMMMYCPADEVYEFYTWDHEFLFNQVNYREE